MKLLITGGTGFIGTALCRVLARQGHELSLLTRRAHAAPPVPGARLVAWEGAGWQQLTGEVDGIVNLAGEPLAGRRWTAAQKQRIRDSRAKTTRALVDAIAAQPRRPGVLVSGSATGYYGPRGDERLCEDDPGGAGFLADTCRAWEGEAQRAESLGVRVVRLRIGVVLGPDGGALVKMVPPFRAFLGGPLGSGRQWMSWVHRDDVIGLIVSALSSPQIRGAVNATAPAPVTMREFCAALGRALHRPSWVLVPAPVLRALLGEMAEVLLTGQRVLPAAAQRFGYRFVAPELLPAIASCLRLGAVASFIWHVLPAAAFAASREAEAAQRNMIVGLTAGVAMLIGLVLYHFSTRSSKGKFQKGAAREAAGRGAPGPGEKDAGPVPSILQELSRLPGPPHKHQQVARAVSEMVTRQVDERVGNIKQEFSQRYNQLTQEHRRVESMLERKYQQTLSEKKQTTAVLESIAEGLVVVNPKGDVVMMNPAAERLLGVRQQERLGRQLTDGMKDEQLVSMVRNTERGEREIVVAAKQDTTKKVLRASNAVISDENGNTVGMVAVLSDVTKQRELEDLKSEFLSKVSHELRTPIVAMRHALAILVDQVAGPLGEEQKKFLEISVRNLDRLNQLINDLLDLSKLEAKKMDLRLAPVAIEAVVQPICETMEFWARSKQITLSASFEPNLPKVLGDQGRLGQVLTNLIGNAIKFTPQSGRVTVEARRGADGGSVQVAVGDTGVGIAAEDLPKLFNKFQQVGERSASDISGTGLGLVISKEIVELHGGRIWVESEKQQGARFIFTVPVAQSTPAPNPN